MEWVFDLREGGCVNVLRTFLARPHPLQDATSACKRQVRGRHNGVGIDTGTIATRLFLRPSKQVW
eukprot:8571731-Heterocapsa_arctica.AAC.1